MSKRQIRQMFRLVASGEAVQLTSPMASVKKLARLAFLAQQFGYEYADVRQGSGRNNALTMLIVPDPGPQAQARAAQNWAQYPQAADGVSLPPVVPDALELLKARINFDLTGKNAEKRMVYAAFGLTAGCVVLGVRAGGDSVAYTVAGVLWAVVMVVLGIGLVVTRKRNAKFAALLRAAGFAPVTEEGGRVRYLPPTAGYGGHAAGPYGGPYTPYASHAPYAGQVQAPAQATAHAPGQAQAQAPGYAPGQAQAPVYAPGQAQAPVYAPGQAQTPVYAPGQAQGYAPAPAPAPVPGPAPAHAPAPAPAPAHSQAQGPAHPQPQAYPPAPGSYGSQAAGPYSQQPPAAAAGRPGNPYASQQGGPYPAQPGAGPYTQQPPYPQQPS
ncbi:hypothetical protein ABZX90_07545 [Streptomyces sp. NPDC002935]|uniref:hypothetical protein n=1 Tax=Streptomyces sp. NPDC002935 TaxID=3154545 RepID=UPI0033BB15BE